MGNSISKTEFTSMILEQANYVQENPSAREWEQLRALFTAYCIVFDYYTDTFETDKILSDVHKIVGGNEESFETYMLAHIV